MAIAPAEAAAPHVKGRLPALTLLALGVVFGDIGTSPLYAIRQCFGEAGLEVSEHSVLGVVSLIFWALILVVSLKYVVFIMCADNRGEGGILALSSLALHGAPPGGGRRRLVILLSILGASLFYGDGIITPAISVLSAVEGLEVAAPALHPYVVPLTLVVLIALFLFQRRGTAKVGALFGPIVCLWFTVLGLLGLAQIVQAPAILAAVNPLYGLELFADHGLVAFLTLGAVFLAVTGAEALYVDMGHFGRTPIRVAWFGLVLPGLVLNYFGQGALLLRDPTAVANPFYLLAPSWGLYPLIALATLATVIASQAVISGAYSLTQQAVQLGYLPRQDIRHTSESAIGQVYLPRINTLLLFGVVGLVIGFGSSDNLAAAYGIAVTGDMLITTLMAYMVVRHVWHWPRWLGLSAGAFFLTIDLSFFGANVLKIPDGGWLPLLLAAALCALMSTWRRGRQALFVRLSRDAMPLRAFIARLSESSRPVRVPGTAVFMTSTPDVVPSALLHNLKHNKVLHERVVLMTIQTEDLPRVEADRRIEIAALGRDFYKLVVRYGFMEEPSVVRALDTCRARGLIFDVMETSFFLSRETFIPSDRPELPPWREKLFVALSNNSLRATEFFRLPTDRVVELGAHVEI